MKKVIKAEDLPEELTEEIIEILVGMAMEFPKKTFDWIEVSDILEERDQLDIILDIVDVKNKKIQEEKEQERWNSLTPDEQAEEKRKIEKSLRTGPEVFRGNILQQEWDSMHLAEIEKEKKKKNKNSKE